MQSQNGNAIDRTSDRLSRIGQIIHRQMHPAEMKKNIQCYPVRASPTNSLSYPDSVKLDKIVLQQPRQLHLQNPELVIPRLSLGGRSERHRSPSGVPRWSPPHVSSFLRTRIHSHRLCFVEVAAALRWKSQPLAPPSGRVM